MDLITSSVTSEMQAALDRLESTRLARAAIEELADVFNQNRAILRAVEPSTFELLSVKGYEPEPEPFEAGPDEWNALHALDALTVLSLPPIRGGSPEPFVPSEQDLADYAAWSESLERSQRDDWMSFNDKLAAIHEAERHSGRLTEADIIAVASCC